MSSWKDFLTTGIAVPSGTTPTRKDVRDLSTEEKYLYMEGLKRFQCVRMDNPKSYFQIAGIHGRPYTTWPDFTWNKDIPQSGNANGFQGFCTHTSILFLTWHRPFLALFEATLYDHVNKVAAGIDAKFSDKAKYVAAAKAFRMPYWDWARKDVQIIPQEALNKTYVGNEPPSSESLKNSKDPELVKPDTLDYNPLFEAPFQAKVPKEIQLDGKLTTIRDVGAKNKLETFYKTEERHRAGSTLITERNLTERVSYILLAYQSFGAMSFNEYFGSKTEEDKTRNAETWGSFEDFHNTIHGSIGGHMNSFARSAFDPIFWLHHTNIDRLFDIWQALHQDDTNERTYVTTQEAGVGSYTVKQGSEEGKNTPLYPFRDTVSSWWTSETVKKTETLGYTYPETKGLQYPSSKPAKEKLGAIIENIYTPLSKMIQQSKQGDVNAGSSLLPQADLLKKLNDQKLKANTNEMMALTSQMPNTQTLLRESLAPSKPFLRDLAPNNKYLEWLVNLKAEKHALDGAYEVHVFLDPVQEDDVRLWPSSPHHVGTFAPMGQAADTGCDKCQRDQANHTQVTGQIPLTLALTERYLAGLLPNLNVENVVPYLTENLHWRIVKTDTPTSISNRSTVNDLTVFVITNEVTIPEDPAALPVYAPDVTIYPQITTKRDGREGRGEGTGLTEAETPREYLGRV